MSSKAIVIAAIFASTITSAAIGGVGGAIVGDKIKERWLSKTTNEVLTVNALKDRQVEKCWKAAMSSEAPFAVADSIISFEKIWLGRHDVNVVLNYHAYSASGASGEANIRCEFGNMDDATYLTEIVGPDGGKYSPYAEREEKEKSLNELNRKLNESSVAELKTLYAELYEVVNKS